MDQELELTGSEGGRELGHSSWGPHRRQAVQTGAPMPHTNAGAVKSRESSRSGVGEPGGPFEGGRQHPADT